MAGLWELQQAVIAQLKADAAVVALVGGAENPRIYDAPQRDPAFPFIGLAEDSLDEAGSVDGIAYSGTIRVGCVDRGNTTGRENAKKINDAVIAALDRQDFTVEGHKLVYCLLQNTQTLPGDYDETEWIGVVSFNVYLNKN